MKINPLKCETIVFRRPVNHIKASTNRKIKHFKISVTDRNTNTSSEIPNKTAVKYLGVTFDHLLRMNTHHKLQITKAKKTIKANARIFYNRNLENKAKIICYQLLVRPIMTYAAPITWNMGPTVMEKYRRLERSILRSCLRLHRTADSGFIRRTKNSLVYNKANIPRIDCFMIKLCRNFFANMRRYNSNILENQLAIAETDEERLDFMKSGYIPPQLFVFADKHGVIQNGHNLPILYHKPRHSCNKSISLDHQAHDEQRLMFDKSLPRRDSGDNHRLSPRFWWLTEDARFIDELRRRTRFRP